MNGLPPENVRALSRCRASARQTRTHADSTSLMDLFRVTGMEVPIHDAVSQRFQDIRHDANACSDITYEDARRAESAPRS